MSRTLRTVLGTAAATAAALAIGLPATSTSASAAPIHYSRHWGVYSSTNSLAKASGAIRVTATGRHSNRVQVSGKLWDFDRRPHWRGGKCAYLEIRFRHWRGFGPHRYYDVKQVRECGYRRFEAFSYNERNVDRVDVRVCQVRATGGRPSSCGKWRTIYTGKGWVR